MFQAVTTKLSKPPSPELLSLRPERRLKPIRVLAEEVTLHKRALNGVDTVVVHSEVVARSKPRDNSVNPGLGWKPVPVRAQLAAALALSPFQKNGIHARVTATHPRRASLRVLGE